ncbi:hypothetical protein BAE44_0016361 [Dichanthelium oligosanthes]|uniref:Uncharacterized protein n=1 Tax=Dichanthelium oligosanthes TaxID=888268 RepID=A0A1E5VBU3_9POAL|nr:hypothetical protein BAE44_0016361 [Dichanthelium oligosanthes]
MLGILRNSTEKGAGPRPPGSSSGILMYDLGTRETPNPRMMITWGWIRLVGFADGSGVIFVGTDHGSSTTDLECGYFKKVEGLDGVEDIVPYVSFYTPALRVASTGEGSRSAVSSA